MDLYASFRYTSLTKAAACAITSFFAVEGERRVTAWSARGSETDCQGPFGHQTHPASKRPAERTQSRNCTNNALRPVTVVGHCCVPVPSAFVRIPFS